MTEKKELYIPQNDPYYAKPYVDVEEWRDEPVRHYFVHGGFEGTKKDGWEAKFCFYFPEKEKYEGRFFQYLSPAPEDEHMSEYMEGEEDKISFSLTHGAYYVVSNQGGFVTDDGERLYKTNANVAEFSRKMAQRVYGYEHRPFGYVHGGSGGSFKTIGCMEMTEGVWDGGIPFVTANPMATPNVFCPRVRAMRILGREGMEKAMDNMEPGGSGNIYDGLDQEQQEALREATKMGFPKRAWFCAPFMGDGALMMLVPYIYAVCPQYFEDFWTKEGYAGADPDSSESRARVQFVTTVKELIFQEENAEGVYYDVDDHWKNMALVNQKTPRIRLTECPPEDAYLYHCRVKVLGGKAKGKECAVDSIENGIVTLNIAPLDNQGKSAFEGLAAGDEIMIDNSDYLAIQTLHRHQVPRDDTYPMYDQFRDEDKNPLYPQLPELISLRIAQNGGGCVPTGAIHGKVIALCSALDESALPWHGDWYKKAVRRHLGEKAGENFRLYYNDNCIHGDNPEDPQHHVPYIGILNQALLTLVEWCENGIEPVGDTNYEYNDGQIELPPTAEERGGLQPVIRALADGQKCVKVKAGQKVSFTAEIKSPSRGGKIAYAAWDFEKTNDFSHGEEIILSEDGRTAKVSTTYSYAKAGTYFPVIMAWSNHNADGSTDDYYTRCKNLDRVRVIVE